MKLFLWIDPCDTEDLGCSILFAVAENETQAHVLAKKAKLYKHQIYHDFEHESPNVSLDSPTRIVDLPCAEWHEWKM